MNASNFFRWMALFYLLAIAGVSGQVANGTYTIVCQLSALALDDPSGGGSGTGTDQQNPTMVGLANSTIISSIDIYNNVQLLNDALSNANNTPSSTSGCNDQFDFKF